MQWLPNASIEIKSIFGEIWVAVMLYLFAFMQFRTQNRFTLLLELLVKG